jgi:hypothetical protein
VAHADIIKFEGLEYPYTSTTGPCLAAHALGTVIVPLHPTLGAAAYAVTQAGARRLLAAGAALSEPFDHVLAYYERHHIPYAETRPFVVRQGAFPSQVTATLQGLPETPAAPAPLTVRIRQHRVYRGSVRLVLATAWVTRARLWPRRPAAYRLGRQWQRALLAARWVLRARLRRLFRRQGSQRF